MLEWRGEQVTNRVLLATQKGINSIMADCVRETKRTHPPKVRTGAYQGSIRMQNAQIVRLTQVVGIWGSFNVLYAKFLEFGTRFIREFAPLRRASDVWYPKLTERIRGFLE